METKKMEPLDIMHLLYLGLPIPGLCLVTSRWPEHCGPSPAVNLQLRGAARCTRRESTRLSACPVPSLGPSLGISGRAGLRVGVQGVE